MAMDPRRPTPPAKNPWAWNPKTGYGGIAGLPNYGYYQFWDYSGQYPTYRRVRLEKQPESALSAGPQAGTPSAGGTATGPGLGGTPTGKTSDTTVGTPPAPGLTGGFGPGYTRGTQPGMLLGNTGGLLDQAVPDPEPTGDTGGGGEFDYLTGNVWFRPDGKGGYVPTTLWTGSGTDYGVGQGNLDRLAKTGGKEAGSFNAFGQPIGTTAPLNNRSMGLAGTQQGRDIARANADKRNVKSTYGVEKPKNWTKVLTGRTRGKDRRKENKPKTSTPAGLTGQGGGLSSYNP